MKTFINYFKVSPLLISWIILVNLFLLYSITFYILGSDPVLKMPLTFIVIFTCITNIKAYQLLNNYR